MGLNQERPADHLERMYQSHHELLRMSCNYKQGDRKRSHKSLILINSCNEIRRQLSTHGFYREPPMLGQHSFQPQRETCLESGEKSAP